MDLCERLFSEESYSETSSEDASDDEALVLALSTPTKLESFAAAGALLAYLRPEQQLRCLAPLATYVTLHAVENAFAVSWLQDSTWVVACRGTETSDWQDVLDDLDIRLKPLYWADGSCVHEGFLRHFQKLQASVLKALLTCLRTVEVTRILFTGHSLGSTSAYLLAMYCAELLDSRSFPGTLLVRSFGGPKLGDAAFHSWCSGKRQRVSILAYQNSCDVVPKVPVRLTENWAQRCIRFQKSELPLAAHSMNEYFKEVVLLEGNATADG